MREWSATVGATDGSIIAAIITTHAPMNHPNAPSAVQGPSSMPCIRATVDHQPMPASARSSATSPSRARTAAAAGARPASPGTRSGDAASITGSRRPREAGLGKPGLGLVGDAEPIDLRALCLRHRQIGADGVEHPLEADGLAGLDTERHDVLDREVDGVADPDAVVRAVVDDLDR